MEYEVTTEEKYTIITLKGEVDLHFSPAARKQILKFLGKKHNVLVDLSQVEYIDSSGVASLVEGYKLARTNGLDFCLLNSSEAAVRVLKLAHLDQIFPMYLSINEYLNGS